MVVSYSFRPFSQDIVGGPSALSSIDSELFRLGTTRAMIVCGKSVLQNPGVVDRVVGALGERHVYTFSESAPHSPMNTVRAGAALAKRFGVDVLVSVGGGSAVTVAKGIALQMATERDLIEFQRDRYECNRRVIRDLPTVDTKIVAVPTTVGCAEIGSSGGAFTETGIKEKVFVTGDGRTSPQLVIVDGSLLTRTPGSILKSTTAGQLRIAVEVFLSRDCNPIGDALSLHAIRQIRAWADEGSQYESSVLVDLKFAGLNAELGRIATGSLGINSALTHHIGALTCGLHGEINGMLLPHTVRFNGPAIPKSRLAILAEALGVTAFRFVTHGDAVTEVISGLARILEQLGITKAFSKIEIDPIDFTTIANATLRDPSLRGNPRTVNDAREIVELLQGIWDPT